MFLLEQMAEGVLLLNRQGILLEQNRAGRPWQDACKYMQPYLKRLIDEEIAGRLDLPISIEMRTPPNGAAVPLANVWLCKNGQKAYALFIVAGQRIREPRVETRPAESGFLMLMGAQARRSLEDLKKMLADEPTSDLGRSSVLAHKATEVAALLKDIADLAHLMGQDLVFAEQKLDFSSILGQAFEMAKHANVNRAMREVDLDTQTLGVVYGDTNWMTYALRVLLECLYAGAPDKSTIRVDVRQMGEFVAIKGSVVMSKAYPTRLVSKVTELNAIPSGPHAHLQICRRILELHGAQLKLIFLDAASDPDKASLVKIDTFTMTLLTGMPEHNRSRVSCANCPITLQAAAFAKDLSTLM